MVKKILVALILVVLLLVVVYYQVSSLNEDILYMPVIKNSGATPTPNPYEGSPFDPSGWDQNEWDLFCGRWGDTNWCTTPQPEPTLTPQD